MGEAKASPVLGRWLDGYRSGDVPRGSLRNLTHLLPLRRLSTVAPVSRPARAMAPKHQAAMPKAAAAGLLVRAARPSVAPGARAPAAAPAQPVAVRQPRGLTSVRFSTAVAAAASANDNDMSARQARAFLMAVKEVLVGEFMERGVVSVAVPHVCRLRMRKVAAREGSLKTVFGKEVELRAGEASKVLKASPAKSLKDRCSPAGPAAA